MLVKISLKEYNELRKRAGIPIIDCVFDRDTKCSALKEKNCINCSFKKTRRELEEGRKNAARRIKSLPNRDYFYKKYMSEQ